MTVKPGYADNQNVMECPVDPKDVNSARVPCPAAGTSFVYLHTAPSETAPLVGGDDYDVEDRNSHAVAGAQAVRRGETGRLDQDVVGRRRGLVAQPRGCRGRGQGHR